MEPIYTMLSVANATKAWPQIENLIAPSLAISKTHSAENIRRAILSGKAQAFVEYQDKIKAIVITEFVDYPLGLFLRVWLGGSTGENPHWSEIRNMTKKFAEDNKCVGLEIIGRKGWAKVFSTLHQEAVMLREYFTEKAA
jgi:hypothetical protein